MLVISVGDFKSDKDASTAGFSSLLFDGVSFNDGIVPPSTVSILTLLLSASVIVETGLLVPAVRSACSASFVTSVKGWRVSTCSTLASSAHFFLYYLRNFSLECYFVLYFDCFRVENERRRFGGANFRLFFCNHSIVK